MVRETGSCEDLREIEERQRTKSKAAVSVGRTVRIIEV